MVGRNATWQCPKVASRHRAIAPHSTPGIMLTPPLQPSYQQLALPSFQPTSAPPPPSTPYQAAYQEVGQGAPVIFLHGFMGSSQCWEAVVPLLANHYHCISLDLLGFGQSSKPKLRYDIALLIDFVHQFVQQKGLKAPILVGHSLGGWVAAAYALAYPVRQLVLVAPAGIRDDSFCGRYQHLRPLMWPTVWVDIVLKSLYLPTKLLRLPQAQALQQILWIRRELKAQPAARSFLVDRMRPEDAVDTVEAKIHQIQAPTLVVAGEQDETIPLGTVKPMAIAFQRQRSSPFLTLAMTYPKGTLPLSYK